MKKFLQKNKLICVEAASAAAQTKIESDIVDMTGYGGIVFFTKLVSADSGAVIEMQIEGGDASNLSDKADIAATSVTPADDDDGEAFAVERNKPDVQYVRCIVTRTTADVALGEIWAILYDPQVSPVDNNRTDEITTN